MTVFQKSHATWRTKVVSCMLCGNGITVGVNTRKARRCIDCQAARAAENMRQMKAKEGPFWDAWLAGNRRMLERLAPGGSAGVSVDEFEFEHSRHVPE